MPHFEHFIPIEGSLQLLHWRLKIFVKKLSVLDAFRRSLVGPPLLLTGNKTWVGGFICLAAAFSGLPILTPIDVEDLFLIGISEDFEMILGTDESSIIGE